MNEMCLIIKAALLGNGSQSKLLFLQKTNSLIDALYFLYGFHTAAKALLYPVSYTHLDVYKRQVECYEQFYSSYEAAVTQKTGRCFRLRTAASYSIMQFEKMRSDADVKGLCSRVAV